VAGTTAAAAVVVVVNVELDDDSIIVDGEFRWLFIELTV
jgi:hypothetical protein